MATHNYDLSQIVIAINGAPILGQAADGDKLTFEPSNDAWTETIGADGEFMRNKMLDPSGDVVINLMYGAAFNSVMQGFFSVDQLTGLGSFVLSVTDINGGFNLVSSRAYIKRYPGRTIGQEGGSVEWQIKVTEYNATLSVSRPI